ncbi:MAG: dipeptidase [Saprospiraceae bacterium]|nr:dipeptidase [Saprospiraceae bacterium]
MKKVQTYLKANKKRQLDELLDMLRIPSVSADPKHAPDMEIMAQSIAKHLKTAGLDSVEVMPTGGYPVVYGEKILNQALPTVLVYGHYDVQPADPIDLWDSPPFEPVIKKTAIHPDGAIFARGSCDDKGQMFMHVKAVEAMIQTGELPCNVKFMIEGEEEVGSVHLGDFCKKYREKLTCSVILISDTSVIANDTPSITTGLRGLTYLEVEVVAANRDLHSGIYGGAVANPINVLCEMIASLHDAAGRVTIPNFYDDIAPISLAERAEMDKAPFNLANYMQDLEIGAVTGEHGYTTNERTSIRPTLDVNGIWGGYIGAGAKTVLPSKANAKISMRLVPNQHDETIFKLFEAHFLSIAPPSVKVRVTPHHGGLPAVTPTDTKEYRAAHLAMEKTYRVPPIPKREGGSIPIVALFEKVLEVKTILMGFGLDSDALHSPNEHYGLFNYYKGIETIPYFYQFYAKLKAEK